jgi:hypothetical protein
MDITMCSGKGCPLKDKCYRTSAPQSVMQSWFAKPPFIKRVKSKPLSEKNVKCEYLYIRN